MTAPTNGSTGPEGKLLIANQAAAPAATVVMVVYNYLAARLAILRRFLGNRHG